LCEVLPRTGNSPRTMPFRGAGERQAAQTVARVFNDGTAG
jgi:hypothetical protein